MNIKIPEQNHVLLVGRLTRDPNTSYTQKGLAVCMFDIAVNRRFKDSGGEWRDDTNFVPIVAWGPIAERAGKKLEKGTPVHIEGRLSSSEYTDKEGNRRKTLKVVARRIQSLAVSKPEEKETNAGETREPAPQIGDDDLTDEVPF